MEDVQRIHDDLSDLMIDENGELVMVYELDDDDDLSDDSFPFRQFSDASTAGSSSAGSRSESIDEVQVEDSDWSSKDYSSSEDARKWSEIASPSLHSSGSFGSSSGKQLRNRPALSKRRVVTRKLVDEQRYTPFPTPLLPPLEMEEMGDGIVYGHEQYKDSTQRMAVNNSIGLQEDDKEQIQKLFQLARRAQFGDFLTEMTHFLDARGSSGSEASEERRSTNLHVDFLGVGSKLESALELEHTATDILRHLNL